MLHRNLPLKLAAAGLAIFLWFWVAIGERGAGRAGEFRIRTSGVSMVSARTLPVILRTRGALPPNLTVAAAQLMPPMVTVVGSSLSLNEITAIPTEELDLNRVSHSGDIRLRLVVPRSIQVPNTDSVQVAVQIAEQRVTESGPLESKP